MAQYSIQDETTLLLGIIIVGATLFTGQIGFHYPFKASKALLLPGLENASKNLGFGVFNFVHFVHHI